MKKQKAVGSKQKAARRVLAATAALFMLAASGVSALGQHLKAPAQPATSAVVEYKLPPEASKAMQELFQEMQTETDRHTAVVTRIADLQAALLKGAGVPQSEWVKREFKPGPDGTLLFVLKPEPTVNTAGTTKPAGQEKPKAEGSGQKAENKSP